jgi:hypothetical protein
MLHALPFSSFRLVHANNIWWRALHMKLLVSNFCFSSWYLLSLSIKYSPQRHLYVRRMRSWCSYPYKHLHCEFKISTSCNTDGGCQSWSMWYLSIKSQWKPNVLVKFLKSPTVIHGATSYSSVLSLAYTDSQLSCRNVHKHGWGWIMNFRRNLLRKLFLMEQTRDMSTYWIK